MASLVNQLLPGGFNRFHEGIGINVQEIFLAPFGAMRRQIMSSPVFVIDGLSPWNIRGDINAHRNEVAVKRIEAQILRVFRYLLLVESL